MATAAWCGRLAVRARGPGLESEARALAAELGVPLSGAPTSPSPEPGFVLELGEDGLALSGDGLRLHLDFAAGPLGRRLSGPGREGVARACGLSRGRRPRILDATAGIGRDAMVLASRGAQVTMAERDPLLCCLLREALARARRSPELSEVLARVRLIEADARTLLAAGAAGSFDVVSLDPMFPPRRKSARVKQDMRLLQVLCGDAEAGDQRSLLEAALASGIGRVVVKRPRGAPDLGGLRPSQRLEVGTTRFDLYLRKGG